MKTQSEINQELDAWAAKHLPGMQARLHKQVKEQVITGPRELATAIETEIGLRIKELSQDAILELASLTLFGMISESWHKQIQHVQPLIDQITSLSKSPSPGEFDEVVQHEEPAKERERGFAA